MDYMKETQDFDLYNELRTQETDYESIFRNSCHLIFFTKRLGILNLLWTLETDKIKNSEKYLNEHSAQQSPAAPAWTGANECTTAIHQRCVSFFALNSLN